MFHTWFIHHSNSLIISTIRDASAAAFKLHGDYSQLKFSHCDFAVVDADNDISDISDFKNSNNFDS